MLDISELNKNYSSFQALNNINLHIDNGEIVGLLGPNGAGKSTLMNIICGAISYGSGSVIVDGFDLAIDPSKIKQNIGYLPEIPPLYPDMTLISFLKFAARLKGLSGQKLLNSIDYVLSVTSLGDRRKQLIKSLSKGLKQRAGIAMALLGNPKLLILDEPSVGLDPNQIIQIRTLIKDLSQDKTILLSTHILGEISKLCTKIVILNKGNILAVEDFNSQLANQNDSGIVIVSLRESSDVNRFISILENINSSIQITVADNVIEIRDSVNKNLIRTIAGILFQNDILFTNLKIKEETLEDLFQRYTGKNSEKVD